MSSFLLYILYKNYCKVSLKKKYCKVHVNETRICLVPNKGCFSSTGTLTVKSFHPSLTLLQESKNKEKKRSTRWKPGRITCTTPVSQSTRVFLPECRVGTVTARLMAVKGARRRPLRPSLGGDSVAARPLDSGDGLAGPETERDGPGLVAWLASWRQE